MRKYVPLTRNSRGVGFSDCNSPFTRVERAYRRKFVGTRIGPVLSGRLNLISLVERAIRTWVAGSVCAISSSVRQLEQNVRWVRCLSLQKTCGCESARFRKKVRSELTEEIPGVVCPVQDPGLPGKKETSSPDSQKIIQTSQRSPIHGCMLVFMLWNTLERALSQLQSFRISYSGTPEVDWPSSIDQLKLSYSSRSQSSKLNTQSTVHSPESIGTFSPFRHREQCQHFLLVHASPSCSLILGITLTRESTLHA